MGISPSTLSQDFSRCLWVTSTHPYWGTAHYLRAHAVKNFFSSSSLSDKDKVVVDLVAIVLSEDNAEPHQAEIIRTSQSSPTNTKTLIPAFTSLARFTDWLEKNAPHYNAVVIDRREPPPVLMEILATLEIPLIGLDLKEHLPMQNQRLNKSYSTALAKLDYVINAIPGLEHNWANLNESEYLLSPFFLQKQNFTVQVESGEKKICFYLGYINDSVYLKSTFTAIASFLMLYKEELARLIGNTGKAERTKTVYVSVASTQVESIAHRVEELQRDNPELQAITYVVESVKELTKTPQTNMYDEIGILFTHFGMFGLECLSAGIPVFFSHPSIYHQELVRRHFPKLELNQVIWDGHKPSLLDKFTTDFNSNGSQAGTVCEIIKKFCLPTLKEKVKKTCELCGGTTQIVHRRQWMNLVRCSTCKSVRLIELFETSERIKWGWEEAEDYDADYFIKEYEESYGKTYREDESVIKAIAKERLTRIHQYSVSSSAHKPKLLDIGCAYGFFLDVAFEQGYATYGMDVSKHAGDEVASLHKFQCGNFMSDKLEFELTPPPAVFDVVTMWYVLEHFANLSAVMERIDKLLKPGGIFAISTPNADGLSARYNSETFFLTSPKDHYYIFSLSGLRKYFIRDYELMGFRATGIHYERWQNLFPRLSRFTPKILYRRWAERNNVGDTMEVYFRKIN